MSVLDEIIERSRDRLLATRRNHTPGSVARAADAAPAPRDFVRPLRDASRINVIAEFKPRSPSAGELCVEPDVTALARDYEQAGAAAMSVLTEPEFFGSSLERLREAREACMLPLLRKDFILDPYQVDEARASGADAVLLIVTALDPTQLTDLVQAVTGRRMAALVEIHDEHELERAMKADAVLLGINQRNLRDLTLDHDLARRILREVPPDVTRVVESGLSSRAQLLELVEAGSHAFLIGSHLMQSPRPGDALRELVK